MGGYNMDTYAGVISRVNTTAPIDPAASALFNRISQSPPGQSQMPLTIASQECGAGGICLSGLEQFAILDWILQGAPNN